MNEPNTIRAGDTVKWSEDCGIYLPSEGWSMKYTVSGSQSLSATAVSTSGRYDVTLSAAQTATLAAGAFKLAQCVERGSGSTLERVTLSVSSVEVTRNLSTASTCEARTHLQIVFDSIKAVIERRATKANEELSINGRSLKRTTHIELLKLYTQYKYLVEDEKRRERIAKGLPPGGNKVLVHFR